MDIKRILKQLFERLFGGNIYPLDDRDRAILINEFRGRLLPVSICLFFVYFILSFLHPLMVKDDRAAVWLSAIGSASTLYFVFLALASKRFKFTPSQTHLAGFSIALILCANSGVHLYMTKEAIQSTNFMLIILGLAFVVTAWSHYLSCLMLVWVIWLVAGPLGFTDANWMHFVIMLGMGSLLSALTFHISTYKLIIDGRTERTLAQAKEMAESANMAKSSFLSRVSHELRTPLNSIIGFSSILEHEDIDKEHKNHISLIRKSGEHLLKLINEILDLSRIETGEISISEEKVLVLDLIDEVSEMIQPIAEKRQVTVRVSTQCSRKQAIAGDHRRILQVFLNLASNGIKYNQEGGTLEISIPEVVEDTIQISFTDTGIGISNAKMHRLFVPFDRLDIEQTTRGIEGTGLGLALCEKLVMEMGGTIHASSEEGKGSTFTVTLRACPVSGTAS